MPSPTFDMTRFLCYHTKSITILSYHEVIHGEDGKDDGKPATGTDSVADRVARERKTSRSKVVSDCLKDLAEKKRAAEMMEGYKVMAKQQKQFAGVASKVAGEVLPEWK